MPINNAIYFLITSFFDFFLFIFLIRLILVAVKADFYNPVCQFVIKLSQRAITPIRRFVPNFRQIELASVVIILVLEILKFALLGLLLGDHTRLLGLAVLGLADAFRSVLNIFFYAVLLQAILTWVQNGYSPLASLLTQMTAPLMRPFRRFVPLIAGFDITPLPVMLTLQLLIILIANPLWQIGQVMAFV